LTAAGTYRVTVDVPCETIRFPQARIQLASAGDQFLQVGALVQPTATAKGYFTVYLWDISGAALADLAADANNRVNFSCIINRVAS
jgi:hypothetical protein